LNFTDVTPEKFPPMITTVAPRGPLVGLKLSILGKMVKSDELVPVPPEVVTETFPVVLLSESVIVICVAERTVNEETLTPFTVTEVAPVRFVPVRVTSVPPEPLEGEKLVTVGAANTSLVLPEPCVVGF